MRNMSLEKSRQREQELGVEIERLQAEIKSLQKSSEDSANISQQLSKDVRTTSKWIKVLCMTQLDYTEMNLPFELKCEFIWLIGERCWRSN